MDKYLEENQKLWDEWASFHPESEFYDMDSFLNGQNSLKPVELEALGDVKGRRLLHLQCHFGQDTLSWARLGAKATGVDFSEKAIEAARKLNQLTELDAQFIQSDVLSLKGKLEGVFDIIFTSYGVITWLPDLRPWAEAIRHYLKPGGAFVMQDIRASSHLQNNLDHPIGTLLYTISTMHCMTVSLAQNGAGLGTVWGEELAVQMLNKAGFDDVEVHQLAHDFQNNFYVTHKPQPQNKPH